MDKCGINLNKTISYNYILIMFMVLFHIFMMKPVYGGRTSNSNSQINSDTNSCQTVCACKWKGGKQTAECIERQLITIPNYIEPNTQVLDISNNNLQILPSDTFQRAKLLNLQKLYLRNCRLGQIDSDAFNGLTNLVELDLSQNLLTGIPTTTFSFIPLLRELTLAKNPIQKIDAYAFKSSHSLSKLDLSRCDIQMIAPLAFDGPRELHSLKLNGNKLSELRPRTVETLSKLHNVELHDNPWLCDCRLRAAKIWLTQNNIPYPVPPICYGGPERVLNRSFADLAIDEFACRPEMLAVSRYVEATSGDNATITCRIAAVPAANVKWYWNGRQLVNSSSFSAYQKIFVYEDGEFEKRSRLVLTNSQETDTSEFYCVAENPAGMAEANFTLHVNMRAAGMASLGSGQIVCISVALVILIFFILLITFVLLVRLRRIPFTESKTPAHLEVITSVSPQSNSNGKSLSTASTNDCNTGDRKISSELKLTNPVQKPPRLTDINYSTANYDGGNGSIMANSYVSPTASAGNNPDLINDTKRLGSGELAQLGIDTTIVSSTIAPSTVKFSDLNGPEAGNGGLLMTTTLTSPSQQMNDIDDRPGSGEYSRAGYDSLYPSGLWEATNGMQSQQTNDFNLSMATMAQDLYMKRTGSTTLPSYPYTDRVPITDSTAMMNLDDEHSSAEYMSRTFPRSGLISGNNTTDCNQQYNSGTVGQHHQLMSNSLGFVGGYPNDYGLPIVPGAEQTKSRDLLQPTGIPANAKTLRVWQRGGVPVLPPVTALKRALTSSRNSPDEGYQEGCGTDV